MPLDIGDIEPVAKTVILKRINDREARIRLKDGRVQKFYWTTRPKEKFTTPPTDKQWKDYAEAWAEKMPVNYDELEEQRMLVQQAKLAMSDMPPTKDEKAVDWLARQKAVLNGS